jgi:tryptophan-rich sensory protein
MDYVELLSRLDWLQVIVGPVWAVLTLIIFWMIYSLQQKFGWKHPSVYFLLALLAVIYLHPFYTDIFPSYAITQGGNILSLLFTIFILKKIARYSRAVAYRLIPMVIWITAASFYTWVKMKAV